MAPEPLAIERLSVTLGGREVLRGVSLRLEAGRFCALLGPNGSGKTTLLRAALGLVPRAVGAVAWEGRPIEAWSRRALARRIGYLPQAPLWDEHDRVIDVLRLGRAPHWGLFGVESSADEAAVDAVVARLDLAGIAGRRMDALSGGQRQRVLIGRALAQGPRALLLDEPATHLDLRHQVDLHRQLRALCGEAGIAVLMASHDLNLAAMHSDRLVVLEGGSVAADGAPDAVLDPALLQRVYGVRMQRVEIDGRAHVVPLP